MLSPKGMVRRPSSATTSMALPPRYVHGAEERDLAATPMFPGTLGGVGGGQSEICQNPPILYGYVIRTFYVHLGAEIQG